MYIYMYLFIYVFTFVLFDDAQFRLGQVLTFRTCIREVLVSNFGRNTVTLTDVSQFFFRSNEYIRSYFNSLQIYHLLIIIIALQPFVGPWPLSSVS
jgi:hypothetical protein